MYSNIKVQGIYSFFFPGVGVEVERISKSRNSSFYCCIIQLFEGRGWVNWQGHWLKKKKKKKMIWTRFKIKWQIDMRIESPLKSQASCPHEDQMMILFTRGHPVYPLICFTTHKTRPCVIVTGTQGYHYSAIINAYFVTDLIQTKILGHCVVNILTILILWVLIWLMN